MTYIAETERPDLYRWLIDLPFARGEVEGGRHLYHDMVRELFDRFLYQRSEVDYYATRRLLAAYYQKLIDQIEAEYGEPADRSADWLELVLALATQLLYLREPASHAEAIARVLAAHTRSMRRRSSGFCASLPRRGPAI